MSRHCAAHRLMYNRMPHPASYKTKRKKLDRPATQDCTHFDSLTTPSHLTPHAAAAEDAPKCPRCRSEYYDGLCEYCGACLDNCCDGCSG